MCFLLRALPFTDFGWGLIALASIVGPQIAAYLDIYTQDGISAPLLDQLPGLGVGGLLAAFIFYQKVKDDKEHAKTLIEQNEYLRQLLERTEKREDRVISVISEMKEGFAALSTVISNMSSVRDLERHIGALEEAVRRREANATRSAPN
jgi:hypothetical protein